MGNGRGGGERLGGERKGKKGWGSEQGGRMGRAGGMSGDRDRELVGRKIGRGNREGIGIGWRWGEQTRLEGEHGS